MEAFGAGVSRLIGIRHGGSAAPQYQARCRSSASGDTQRFFLAFILGGGGAAGYMGAGRCDQRAAMHEWGAIRG